MKKIIQKSGSFSNNIGKLGRGLGMQLTKWPSNTIDDNTKLKDRVVLTLEPSMEYLSNKEMVYEENVLITNEGL